jgi:branched-chain amino acid transport system permease protein
LNETSNIKSSNSLRRPKVYIPLLIIAFFAVVPILTANSYILHMFILCLFFAAISQAWNILAGLTGQVSIGHAAFFGVGAFSSTVLLISLGVSPWIGMWVGSGLSILLSLAFGGLCFRIKGPYFTIVTMAFAGILMLIFSDWNVTGGFDGLFISARATSGNSLVNFWFLSQIPYFYFMLGLFIIVFAVTFKIQKSKIGLYFAAVREDEVAAQSLGINVFKWKMVALVISVLFTAMLGTFYAQYVLYIYAGDLMSLNFSLKIALPAIIGGLGTLAGPLVGAFILIPLAEFINTILGGGYPGLYLIIYGIILIFTVLIMPQGVVGVLKKSYESGLKKLPGGKKD